MAKIQRINPTLNRPTNQSPQQPIQEAGAFDDVVVALGKTGQQIGEVFKQASLLREKTQANNFLDMTLRDINDRAQSDNDISKENQQKYRDEIDKAISDAAEKITIPVERSVFSADALGKGQITDLNISNDFKRKEINIGKEELNISLDAKEDEFIQAKTEVEKNKALVERNELIEDAAKAGYLEPSEVVKAKNELNKQWAKRQVIYDISTDPALAEALLERKVYKDITESERVEFLAQAKAAKKKLKAEADLEVKKQQADATEEMISMDIDGKLTVDNLSQFRGRVTESTYRTQLNKLVSPNTVDPVTKASTWNEIQDAFVALAIETDDSTEASLDKLAAFRNMVLEAMGKGEITQDDGQKFLKDVSVAFSDKVDEEAKKQAGVTVGFAANFMKSMLLSPLLLFAGGSQEEVDKIKMDMIKEYSSRLEEGQDPEEARDKVIENQQKRSNPKRDAYKIGDIIPTPVGNVKVVGFHPDGEPDVEILGDTK